MSMAVTWESIIQTFQMAEQARGIESWGSHPYNDDNVGWLSILGYDSWLISNLTTDNTGYAI